MDPLPRARSGPGLPATARSGLGVVLASWLAACTPPQVEYAPAALSANPAGPAEAVLYLVGDAGDVNPERADVLAHLARDLREITRSAAPPPVWVTFLGDNIYDEGLPFEPSEEDLQKLGGQASILSEHPSVRGVFLPGNHDWANGASVADGLAAIERQREWIERFLPDRDIGFLPGDGCPGPAGVDGGGSVRLVFVDTEWLLRAPEERCGSADDFYARLTDELALHRDRRVVILTHHPLVSGGPHGGNVAPLARGPLVYFLAVKSGASIQDIASPRYSTVVRRIREAIATSGARPLVFASGHDHTLQVIRMSGPGAPAFQLVSGAGSRSERSKWVSGMRYAKEGYGYMRIVFGPDDATLTVFARDAEEGPVRGVFECTLSTGGSPADCPEAPRAEGGR